MIGLLGTVTGMIRAFATLGASGIGDPSSLSSAIGEVLVATASGLFIAIPAFMAFYFLRNRATAALHHIQDIISSLFRKMPYEAMVGVHIGDDVIFAAQPAGSKPRAPHRRPNSPSSNLNLKSIWQAEERRRENRNSGGAHGGRAPDHPRFFMMITSAQVLKWTRPSPSRRPGRAKDGEQARRGHHQHPLARRR